MSGLSQAILFELQKGSFQQVILFSCEIS